MTPPNTTEPETGLVCPLEHKRSASHPSSICILILGLARSAHLHVPALCSDLCRRFFGSGG